MIDVNTLYLESDWGEHWKVSLNLLQAFPNTKTWIKQFDKRFVKRSQTEPFERPIWEQVVWWLETSWKDENLKLIGRERDEIKRYEELAACGNKEDKKKYKKWIQGRMQTIRTREKNESKVKENIQFIRDTFL